LKHHELKEKDIVAGLGEIGNPILRLISKATITVGYDINPKLMDATKFAKLENINTSFLHVCIPFNGKFTENVLSLYIENSNQRE
jgi:UDP-N-acetyl-D-mannosaminuronate dehydrogenase